MKKASTTATQESISAAAQKFDVGSTGAASKMTAVKEVNLEHMP